MWVSVKTEFKSLLEKDSYYQNIMNILYGVDKKITYIDNNRFNIDYSNLIFN